jgi:hypothetical protein
MLKPENYEALGTACEIAEIKIKSKPNTKIMSLQM